MNTLLDGAALVIAGAGVLVSMPIGAIAGLRTAVEILLDFLLAAGLLRITADPEWDRIVTTAVIVTIRHLLTAGIQASTAPSARAKH